MYKRQILYAVRAYLDLDGKPHLLEYCLLVEQGMPVRYGVSIGEDVYKRQERGACLCVIWRGLHCPFARLC